MSRIGQRSAIVFTVWTVLTTLVGVPAQAQEVSALAKAGEALSRLGVRLGLTAPRAVTPLEGCVQESSLAELGETFDRIVSGEVPTELAGIRDGFGSGYDASLVQSLIWNTEKLPEIVAAAGALREKIATVEAAGGIALRADGTIESDVLGLPDNDTLEAAVAARDLLERIRYDSCCLDGRSFPVEPGTPEAELRQKLMSVGSWMQEADTFLEHLGLDSALVHQLADSIQPSLDALYTGRHALLEQVMFREPNVAGFRTRTLREMVEKAEPQGPAIGWWVRAPEINPRTGVPFATITAETSRSPLKSLYGAGSYRHPMWVSGGTWQYYDGPNNSEPFLEGIRFAANYDAQGRPRSVEMLYRYEGNWEPFFFVRRAGMWLPARNFVDVNLDENGRIVGEVKKGRPVEESCIQCHATERGSGILSPLPHFLKTPQDLRDVGYADERLIRRLLESGAALREGRNPEGAHGVGWH